ncbi:hypothetical protein JCM8097_000392 [Rhodosporidiobolus ruineniae]
MADPSDLDRPMTQQESESLLGPCSVGWALATWLSGMYFVLHVQYIQSRQYARIVAPVKVTIWAVFLLVMVFTGMCIAEQWSWNTTTNVTLLHALNGNVYESFPPLVAGLISSAVQALLTIRTATLISHPPYRYAFVGFLCLAIAWSLTASVLVCASNLVVFYANRPGIGPWSFNNSLAAYLWTSAGIDLIISTALALTLRRRVAGFNEKTDSLLNKLVKVSLQTAAYTTILAIIGATTASIYGTLDPTKAFIDYAFWPPLPACYGISLYTTLSTRRTVEEYIGSSIPLPGSAQHNISEVRKRPTTPLPRPVTLKEEDEDEPRPRLIVEARPMLFSSSNKGEQSRRDSADEVV